LRSATSIIRGENADHDTRMLLDFCVLLGCIFADGADFIFHIVLHQLVPLY